MIAHSSDYRNHILTSPHIKTYIRIDLYDSLDNKLLDSIEDEINKDSIGTINVSGDSDIRRTFSFAFNNISGKYTWGAGNLLWTDKKVKVYKGIQLNVKVNGERVIEYLPQGEFLLTNLKGNSNINDIPVTIVEGKDKAHYYTGKNGKFETATNVATGTDIKAAIKTIANRETKFLFDNIDAGFELTRRNMDWDAGENRWTAIKDLADMANCDIYYDVNGYLRLKVKKSDWSQDSPIWEFTNEVTEDNKYNVNYYAGGYRELKLNEFYNHIIVLGGSTDEIATVRLEEKIDDTLPEYENNPYSIQKIGHRIYFHNGGNPDPNILTVPEAQWRMDFEKNKRMAITEEIGINIFPLDFLEIGDVIKATDVKNGTSENYIVRNFSVPGIPVLMPVIGEKITKVI